MLLIKTSIVLALAAAALFGGCGGIPSEKFAITAKAVPTSQFYNGPTLVVLGDGFTHYNHVTVTASHIPGRQGMVRPDIVDTVQTDANGHFVCTMTINTHYSWVPGTSVPEIHVTAVDNATGGARWANVPGDEFTK